MAEVDYDKLIEPTEGDIDQEETQAEHKDAVESQTNEESTSEADEADSKQGSRANDRIRQLVDEKNELKTRLEALEKLQAGLNEKLGGLLNKEPEPEPEPEVDFMDDPKGYVDVNRQRLEQRIQSLERQDTEANDQLKQELEILKFQQQVGEYERTFSTEHPDYLRAIEFNRKHREEELTLMGVTDKEQVKNIIGQEEIFLASSNMRGGNNPAQAAYDLAVKRGYRPQAVDTNKVTEELDERVGRREKAMDAESMGSSSSPSGQIDEDPELEGWGPIVEAYAELYGAKAAKEMFGDLME